MRPFLLLPVIILFFSAAAAQKEKNYILEINGDTVSLSMDEPASLKTRNGQTLTIRLKQKEILTYQDETLLFQYPSQFSISKKNLENIEQILCMSAGGNGIIIQKYKDIDPELLIDLMLAEITEESKNAGYTETRTVIEKKLKSGKSVSGKRSALVLDDETNIYEIYPVKINKGGIIVICLFVNPGDEKEMAVEQQFWNSLETKN